MGKAKKRKKYNLRYIYNLSGYYTERCVYKVFIGITCKRQR